MSKNGLIAAGLIALILLSAVAVMSLVAPASADNGGSGARYHVVANDSAFVLYDTSDSSKSWILTVQGSDKRQAWLPVKRLDSETEVQNWKLINSARQ